jgi:hypothetical protein
VSNWRDKTGDDYSSPLKTAGKPTAYKKDGGAQTPPTDSPQPEPTSVEPDLKRERTGTPSAPSSPPGRRRTIGVLVIFAVGVGLGAGLGWWLKPAPPYVADIRETLAGISKQLQQTQATNTSLQNELLKVGKRVADMESWQRRVCQKRAPGDCD